MVSSLRSQEMIRQKLRKLWHVTMGGIVGSDLGRLRTFGLSDQQFIEVKVILLFFCSSLFGSQKLRQIMTATDPRSKHHVRLQ